MATKIKQKMIANHVAARKNASFPDRFSFPKADASLILALLLIRDSWQANRKSAGTKARNGLRF